MNEPAVAVRDLGKLYRIGRREKYRTFREAVARALLAPLRRVRGAAGEDPELSLWALRHVGFEVAHGEVVGIVGRNGAGKSTLLRVLSRITEPTEGEARIHGRIGSLLEVGTGFHQELTGRENIYLNGAILGMRRAEIARRFDEIVAFSEVDRFLDTPVKHYSSGMYMRLAFAIAAHLEPEILLVDEVLAVGDASFQRKCLGKMDDVARQGRTVLFVSHDMRAVRSLCPRAILLEGGRLALDGASADVIGAYNRQLDAPGSLLPVRTPDLVLHAFEVRQGGERVLSVDGSLPFEVLLEFEVLRDLTLFRIGVYLKTASCDTVFRSLIADWEPLREQMPGGHYRARLEVPADQSRPSTIATE